LKEKLPAEILGKLYQFQIKGVEFSISRHGRVFIGDEMGTGKTIQALCSAYIYREEWPMIIVTPAALKYVWYAEILKWLPMIKKSDIEIITQLKKITPAYSNCTNRPLITIISYCHAKELLASVKVPWKVIIADEAHYIKNREAKRTKILSPIFMAARRVILLSGTPMLGRPSDIYNNLHILRPDIFKCFREFGHRYCDPKKGRFGIEWKGSSNAEELHLLITNTVVIRRVKNEVLNELPSKNKQKIEVEADQNQIKKIKKAIGKFTNQEISDHLLEKPAYDISTKSELNDSIMQAYRLTGMAKIGPIIEFLDNLIENDVKFIFFAQHLDVLNAVTDNFKRRELDFIRIDGEVPIPQRTELIAKFQNNVNCKIAILSLTASSQGITLTAANTVVFGEYNWTPGIMDQAEARAHRVGQIKSVNVYYIHANDTLDTIMRSVVKFKGEMISKVMDGKGAIIERIEDMPPSAEKTKLRPFLFTKKSNGLIKSQEKPHILPENNEQNMGNKTVGIKRELFEQIQAEMGKSQEKDEKIIGEINEITEQTKINSQDKLSKTKPGTVSKRYRHETAIDQEIINLESNLNKSQKMYGKSQ